MDYKQVGGGAAAGGGVVALLLTLFQQQGVDMMSEKYKTETKVVLERALSNSERINRIESRIERGFGDVKDQLRDVSDVIREGIKSRWTKDDHDNYARQIDSRIERLESQMILLKSEILSTRKDR